MLNITLVLTVSLVMAAFYPSAFGDDKPRASKEAWRDMDERTLRAHVIDLAKKKNFAELEAIFSSDIPFAWDAAGVYSGAVESDKVIGFCTRFELGSQNWKSAFWALASHPKEKVIGYVKQLATSSSPRVRAHCYALCRTARWNDLVDFAKEDLAMLAKLKWEDKQIGLGDENFYIHVTLDRPVSEYLKVCKEEK